MASQKVHGITIDLDVDSSGVSQAFSDVNKTLSGTQRELKTVDNLLKEDTNNVVLLTQKQTLLSDAIDQTATKLAQLGRAKAENDRNPQIDKESKQYRELERDIEKTKRQLEDLTSKQKDNNDQLDKAKRGIENVGTAFEETTSKAATFGDVLKANVLADFIVDGLKAVANTVKDFALTLNEWAEEFRELEVYERQFESNLRNTADASDDQIKSLKALAKQKERNGVISSKAITSAYQELATYVESADAIEGLTDALTDMAAQQYGVDASEESVRNLATTLGKALANGDYSGLTRLGYGFTDAQQRIMKYGDELQRVKVLNDVIESSIGGVNEALAQTDAGKIFEASSYFGDVKERIGEIVSMLEVSFVEQIFPMVQELTENVLMWVIEHQDEFVELVQNIVEFLTSDEAMEWFTKMGELVEDLWETLEALGEIFVETGIVEGAVWAVSTAIGFVRDLVASIRDILRTIRDEGLFSFMMGNYNSYDWGSGPDSFTPGWSGGFGALNSGGFLSSGISVNANFTINNGNNINRSTVQQWGYELADAINLALGQQI